jgi:hypothetical protein
MKYPNLRSFRSLVEVWFAREVVQPILVEVADAQDAAIQDGLAGVTPEVLVRAVFTPGTSEEALVEAENRLAKSPLANRFAFRLLVGWRKEQAGPLTAEDEADLDDAVAGLRGCCFTAIGDWSVPGDRPTLIYNRETERWVRTDRGVTAAFIEDRLLFEMQPYRGLSAQALLTMALERRFKDLPRAIKCDLMDEFDKANTRKAKVLKFRSYSGDPTLVDARCHTPAPDSRPDAQQAIGLLVVAKDELVAEIGEEEYQTLLVVADYAQGDEFPDTRGKRKSGVTDEIGRKFDLSEREARGRKKLLYDSIQRAQRNGSPVVMTLYELLAGPPVEPDASVVGGDDDEVAGENVSMQAEPPDQFGETRSETVDEDSTVFEEISE